MTISIYTEHLFEQIRDEYLAGLSLLPTEVGDSRISGAVTESEFERAAMDADSSVRQGLHKFILNQLNTFATNSPHLPEEFVYEIYGSERRLAGKQQVIADGIGECLRSHILESLFKLLMPELSKNYSEQYTAKMLTLVNYIQSKHKPLI